jgi:hypothetical protein
MKLKTLGLVVLASAALLAQIGQGRLRVAALLSGVDEVPTILTGATGQLTGDINERERTITLEVRFENLSGAPTQAHIHFAQKAVNGPVMLWLCGSESIPGPSGTPRCPTSESGVILRALTATEVAAVAAQGVPAGGIIEAIRAIATGSSYVNLHTVRYPGGELRGQVEAQPRN